MLLLMVIVFDGLPANRIRYYNERKSRTNIAKIKKVTTIENHEENDDDDDDGNMNIEVAIDNETGMQVQILTCQNYTVILSTMIMTWTIIDKRVESWISQDPKPRGVN